MSEISPRLQLPLIAAAQAMKHVTHNEALAKLDAITQLTVQAFGLTSPPETVEEGMCFATGADSTGAWAGQSGELAQFINGGWQFITPREGWQAWGVAEAETRVFSGGTWFNAAVGTDNLVGVGVNTTSDLVNRLAVASGASLFSHEGAGHQIKVNKAEVSDTASLLFQTNWSGHAEMGLNGSNDWSVKVSPDGTTWTDALVINGSDGTVSGAGVQIAPDDTTTGRLMRADYGYGPGNVIGTVSQTGGTPTGAVIETGSNENGTYTRFADGTQMCWSQDIDADMTTPIGALFRSQLKTWAFPAEFSQDPFVHGGNVSDPRFFWVTVGQAGSTSCRSSAFCYTSLLDQSYTLCAIGRWY